MDCMWLSSSLKFQVPEQILREGLGLLHPLLPFFSFFPKPRPWNKLTEQLSTNRGAPCMLQTDQSLPSTHSACGWKESHCSGSPYSELREVTQWLPMWKQVVLRVETDWDEPLDHQHLHSQVLGELEQLLTFHNKDSLVGAPGNLPHCRKLLNWKWLLTPESWLLMALGGRRWGWSTQAAVSVWSRRQLWRAGPQESRWFTSLLHSFNY